MRSCNGIVGNFTLNLKRLLTTCGSKGNQIVAERVEDLRTF